MDEQSRGLSEDSVGLHKKRPTFYAWSTVGRWIERAMFTAGLGLLAIYGVMRLESCLSSRAAMKRFAALESSALQVSTNSEPGDRAAQLDSGSWDQSGVRSYTGGESTQFGAPIAVLQIPKIHLTVPLLDGTDDLTLNHAVGHITGTALPGGRGNIGIAGHRDGVFRGLKDVGLGDPIELRTLKGTDTYVVDQIRIVTPDNVKVLRPRPYSSLTLITCYPFYFIGSAPKRYVVMASLTHEKSSGPESTTPGSESQIGTQIRRKS